ncbi:BAR adaptor protein Hob1 [Mucor circinelloides]
MSWKGFQKAMSRLPHQIMSKKGDVTRDEGFIQLETRFIETTKMADRLRAEAQAFRDSVSALLTHQAEMASYLSVIYSQHIGVEVEEGGVQRRVQPTPAAALQAANDAEAAMAYCRDEILPELDSVDQHVIRPSLELQEIIKTIQKTIVKRNHKLIDYDRHRVALQKLQVKTERTMNEEKAIFKVQNQLDTATQDYEYLNNALKEQLPAFFQMLFQLIQPIFEHMYNLQCKIYGMIYARCYELVTANEQYFVTHAMELEAGYNWRKQQHDVQAEIQNMDLLKSGGKAWLTVSGGTNKLSLQERAALKNNELQQQPHQITYQQDSYQQPVSTSPPPPQYQVPYQAYQPQQQYQAPQQHHTAAPAYGQQQSSPAGGLVSPTAAPTPPTRDASRSSYVVALYDYDAQAEGDLSFKKDDKIELVQRTQDANDWWTGRLRGAVGVFPGNYVAEL